MSFLNHLLHRKKPDISEQNVRSEQNVQKDNPLQDENKPVTDENQDSDRPVVSKRAVVLSCVLIAGAVCAGIWQNDMSAEAVDSGESQRVTATPWPHMSSHYNLKRVEWSGAGAATITPVTYDFGTLLEERVVRSAEDTSGDNSSGSSSSGGSHSGGGHSGGSKPSSSSGTTRSRYGRTLRPRPYTSSRRTNIGNISKKPSTKPREKIRDLKSQWTSEMSDLAAGTLRSAGKIKRCRPILLATRSLRNASNASAYSTYRVVVYTRQKTYKAYNVTICTSHFSVKDGRVTSKGPSSVVSTIYKNTFSTLSAANTTASIDTLIATRANALIAAHAADADDSDDDDDNDASDVKEPDNYSGDEAEDFADESDDDDDDDADPEDEDAGDSDDDDDDEAAEDEKNDFEKTYKGALGTVQYDDGKGNPVSIFSTWYLDQGIKTINNVRDDYIDTNKALLFIPRSLIPEGSWKKGVPVEMVSAKTKGIANLTEHPVYGNAKIYASDVDNLNIDKYTKGSSKAQRKENAQLLMDHVMTGNGTGVFSKYLHTLFREKDHSKWESEDIEGDTGKKYKVHDHDKLFDDLRKNKSALLKEARKNTYYKKAKLYYALSANVYKSGNRYYMSPKTISDYSAISAFNYLKHGDAAKDDLKLIMDNNKKNIKFYGNRLHIHGDKEKRTREIETEQDKIDEAYESGKADMLDSKSTEKDVYNYYHLNSDYSYSHMQDFKARIGQSRIGKNNYDCGQYSQVASYINNEYAVAYLDSLMCGYNIAYNKYVHYCGELKKEKDKNGKPLKDSEIKSRKAKAYSLVQRWENAITTELNASDTNKSTSKMVSMRIDVVGGTYSQGRKKISLASFGEYASATYGAKTNVGILTKTTGDDNRKENIGSVSQSFYGVTGGTRSEKIDKNSPWYDKFEYTRLNINGKERWGRAGVHTISDALDIGNVYDRIYKAAKKNSKGRPEYSADDNDWAYITWSQNVIDNNKIKDSKNFSGVAKRARSGQMLYDRIDNIHKYNYGYAHTSPVALYRVAKEPPTPKHPAFELRVHSEKANGSANGAVLTDNNYPDGVGKLKNDNGIEIHDTAETAGGTKKDNGITVTKAGANIMQDRISLKIDSPNTEGIFDKLQGEDVKIVVKYEIGTEKDASLDPNQISDRYKENMKLVDMSKAQDKENILADAEKKKNYTYLDKTKLKIDSLNSKSDDKREDFTPTPESASTDKPKPKDGEDDNAIYYEPASENNDSQVSASDSTSVYYGKDSAWLDAKDAKNNTYKNLVWQQGISEMADTGFSFSVPDEKKWEHYYRICIKAKIGVFKPGDDSSVYDQPYYDDRESHKEGWSEGYIYTNPVYVTYHVTRSRPDNPNEFYGNSGTINNYDSAVQHGYAEFKEGSVYNETFEAMAGVPTTRTMYFATGGEEFIINLQAVYDDYVAKKGTGTTTTAAGNVDHNEYKTKRLYTVHFKGIDCEYKEGDTFKGGVGPSSDAPAETFAADANDNKDGSSAVREHNSAVQPKSSGGLSDYNVTTQSHNTATRFYAEWTGTIANNTPRPGNNFDGFDPGKPGSPCPGLGFDVGNGASRKMDDAKTKWNVNDYNNALRSATDWAKDMEKTSRDAENGTVWRWDDSDGAKRIYHCGKAQVTVSLRDGAMQYGNNCGASPNLGAKSGTYGSDCYSDEKLESDEKDVLGAGWSWQNGQNGEGGGHVNACGGHFNVCSSTDKDHVHTEHDPGYYNPGKNAEDGPNATISYTITVTFTDGNITSKFLHGNSSNGQVECSEAPASSEIPAHAMCGSCCEHVLPDLYDKWQQKLRYDTVRFSAAAVWKIDDGYAGDTGYDSENEMAAIKKKTPGSGIGADNLGIEDQAEDDPSWAPGTQDWDGVSAITGNEAQFVRSKIVRYDPNIFYNIAQSETSRAGRLRYSLQAGQDDNVYWEEMGPEGRSNGYTRSNLCDGRTGTGWDSQTYASFSSRIGGSNYTPNVSVTPVHVQASGHKKSFCRGCLYNNPDSFSNDMYHHNNPKASTTDYVSWNGLKDGNKTTIGPDARTKTAMTSNTADAVDKQSWEWKRFDRRRAQKNTVKVISDFLILQTSSGDQSVYYYDNSGKTLTTERADENFSDDFWYSKPAKSDFVSGRYVENTPAAAAEWNGAMWLNNPLRLDTNNEHVNIGGYNGRYTDVNGKYKGEGGGKTIPTAFDDDGKIFTGANKDDLGLGARVYNNNDGTGEHTRTVETAAKQTEDQRLCSSDLDRPEALGFSNGYVSSPGCGNTFNSLNYDTADEGSARASRNTYDFYTAPTMQSAWGDIIWKNRIPNPSAAKFGNADLVLLQDGISMNPTITNREYDTGQSYVFYKQILSYHNKQADSSAQDSKWDTPDKQGREYGLQENHSQVNNYEFSQQSEENRYLHKTGLTFFSTYCDNYATTDLYKRNAVNNIVIHNPVSVANSFVIGADSKYDQRIYGSDKSNAATAKAEEGEEKCPGNAADCVFRVQNCKYAQRIRKAAFSVDNAEYSPYDENDPESGGSSGIVSDVQTNGGVNTVTYLDDTGFTLERNDGVKPAYPVSGSDPADSDGNVKHPGRYLKGSKGASLSFNWEALGTDTSKKNERYEVGGSFTFAGSGEEALFSTKGTTVKRRADGKIEIKAADGKTYVSEETVGSGKHSIAYRFAFDSVLLKDTSVKVGGKTYTFKANTGVKVDGKDLTFKGGLSGTHGMKIMTDTYGTWARILYQDVSDGNNYFTSASDAEDSDGAKKFSKLKYLDEFRGSDGKFTFMLDYPDATGNFAGAHNIWKQSSNPYTAQKTNGSGSGNDADGFEDIDYQVPGYKGRGLEYNGGSCVLDGTVGNSDWWIAVGSIDTDHGYRAAGKQGGMPAWHNGVTSQNCAEVELWVLVNNQGGGIPYLDNMGSGFTIGNAEGGNTDASYQLDNIWVDRLPGSTEHTAGCFSLGDESHEMTSQDYYNGTGSLSGTKAKSYSFDYTGKEQSITLPAGTYTFEAWGASGGGETVSRHAYNSTGGEGGYTKASFTLKKETEVKVYVGGAGKYGTSATKGGYNGGGSTAAGSCGSGGGATDFRLGSGLKSRFLVAGGGGGADNGTGSPVNASASLGGADDGSGGSGGGKTAQGAWIDGTYHKEYGATQNSGNALGQGASATAVADTGGAGGGWYGGLCTNNNNGGAGGGSGYIKGGAGFSGDYVSDQGGDKNVILETLDETVCKVGGNTGNGKAKITLSASSVSGGADTDLRREPVKTKTLISDSESYSGSCPDNASYYTDFRQYSVDAPFREDEMFQLDCDVKGSGTLVNYFYGASNYLKVDGVYSPTTGSSGTAADGHNEVRLTSDYKHYTVRFRLSGNGDGNVTKYVLFRVFPGSSASVKNVKFVKYSAASQGLIDWTAKYDKGQMTQAGRNNTHNGTSKGEIRHTLACMTEASDAFKLAVNEASYGDSTDLKKMLGTTVWNQVRSRLDEATGSDTFSQNSTVRYDYKGKTDKVTLVPGTYEIDAYGAKGGNDSQTGGYGGHAKGEITVSKNTTIYIAAGGKGADSATGNGGGYNGGGNAGKSGSSGAGGGATSVSLADGTLQHVMSGDTDDVLLVAGGGGGGGNQKTFTTQVSSGRYRIVHSSGCSYEYETHISTSPTYCTLCGHGSSCISSATPIDDSRTETVSGKGGAGGGASGGDGNFVMEQTGSAGTYRIVHRSDCAYANETHISTSPTYCTQCGHGSDCIASATPNYTTTKKYCYGGSSSHSSLKGFGGDSQAADGAGGGGGYYGGEGAVGDVGAGGGSGYVSSRFTSGSQESGVNDGNGYVTIKVIKLNTYSPSKMFSLVKDIVGKNAGLIPATVTTEGHTIINPFWACGGKYNKHVCTDQCKTRANGKVGFVLNCPEPHHTGSHYEVGDEMCYDACHDDAKHAAAAKGDTAKDPKTGKPESAGERFIRLDNYFDVKYPNTGNFYESNLHGIHSTTDTKGMSYVNDMDCFEWTREKWIKFPYDTLYYRESTGLWEEHQAEEWYQVDVFYTTADGKAVPYTDYHFYCQLDGAQGSTRNSEVKDGIVEFYVESINDPGPDGSPYGYLDPYGRDEENTYSDEANRNPDITNATRYFQRNGNLMHSAYTNAYKQDHIDVVGRIGNLLFEDTQDWRFSNFFKKADRSGEWNVDGIVKKVDQNIQNMYFSWHRNTKGANGLYDTAEDLRGEKVKPENEWYNTYTTAKWTDIGDDFYKSAPAPLEAYDSYMAQYTQTGGVAEQLETDQMKFGYNLLWDISTIGDYYKGNLQIEPKYFALDTKTDEIIPVDVYQKTDSSAKPVNYFGLMDEYVADDADGYGQSRYKKYSDKLGQGYPMTLDWKHEAARRNCTGKEADQTQWVGENYGIDTGETYIDPATGSEKVLFAPKVIPHGEAYTIGTAQFMYLGDRARTYIGNDHVTALHNDIKSVDNPSGEIRDAGVSGNNQELYYQYSPLGNQQEELAKQSVSEDATDHFYYIYGQRWHVTLGLPTDAAFTDARDKDGDGLPDHIDPFSKITDENGNEEYAWEQFDYENKYKGRYVFLETATITAIGPVWNLRYDQKVDNGVVNLKVDGTYKEYKFVQDKYFPTLLAVYDGIPNKSDVNILQTH